MNPSGMRIEEKKSSDSALALMSSPISPTHHDSNKSQTSYKSTHSTRSSVLERAREYNRRIDKQNLRQTPNTGSGSGGQRRAKSLERGQLGRGGDYYGEDGTASKASSEASPSRRSVSAGRMPRKVSSTSTRERAMASVRKDTSRLDYHHQQQTSASRITGSNTSRELQQQQPAVAVPSQTSTEQTHPLTPASTNYSSGMHSPQEQSYNQQQLHQQQSNRHATTPTARTTSQYRQQQQQQQQQQPKSAPAKQQQQKQQQPIASTSSSSRQQKQPTTPLQQRSPENRSMKSRSSAPQQQQRQPPGDGGAIVTPELLVDALSGHEDGLLAIAERLMEHYDSGYDVMGEAIIDAFADVQKLFQHVVEAAHMEGAAFEASRREEEMTELRRRAAAAGDLLALPGDDPLMMDDNNDMTSPSSQPLSPNGPTRHDEFIDQDVKDVLTDAIRKGTARRDQNQHGDCYEIYERACQAASSLLPVDSDHRGRLQLSIARAESMSAERACAILRYSMDDVLRSGMRAQRTPLPDPSKRADVVLSRPKSLHAQFGNNGQGNSSSVSAGGHVVMQSSDEALASLQEELKEILTAPVYNNTPLQTVSRRFWAALSEAQKSQSKNEERLEQQLGKLKGDYLLAKAEWEEKLNQSNETAETYKEKYESLKERSLRGERRMEQAESYDDDRHYDMSAMHNGGSVRSGTTSAGRGSSVASLGSGLAQQAKTLVNSMNNFNCAVLNDRSTGEFSGDEQADFGRSRDMLYGNGSANRSHSSSGRRNRNARGPTTPTTTGSSSRQQQQEQQQSRGRSTSASRKSSRSFRQYSVSPQRVDV